MVDRDLLEQVMRLDVDARRQLRDALDDSLPVEMTPQLAALLDERIAQATAEPSDGTPWETIRDRAHAKIAAAKKTA